MSDIKEDKSIDRYISNLTDDKVRERLTVWRVKTGNRRVRYGTIVKAKCAHFFNPKQCKKFTLLSYYDRSILLSCKIWLY